MKKLNFAYTGTDYSRMLSISWNSQYQLEEVLTTNNTNGTNRVQYAYDVLGRRISRTETLNSEPGSTNTEFYIYDGNQVVADLDGDGNVIRTYVWGAGIDNLLAFTDYFTSNTY